MEKRTISREIAAQPITAYKCCGFAGKTLGPVGPNWLRQLHLHANR